MDTIRDYHTEWSKSERERQIPYDITYIWSLKYDTNEPIYKADTDLENELWLPGGRVGRSDRLGVWDWHVHTAILKMDNQQRPTV